MQKTQYVQTPSPMYIYLEGIGIIRYEKVYTVICSCLISILKKYFLGTTMTFSAASNLQQHTGVLPAAIELRMRVNTNNKNRLPTGAHAK